MFTRIVAIISLCIPLALATKTIISIKANKIEKTNDFSSPSPQYLATAFLFCIVPFCWILFNIELRNYFLKYVFKNRVHSLLQTGNSAINQNRIKTINQHGNHTINQPRIKNRTKHPTTNSNYSRVHKTSEEHKDHIILHPTYDTTHRIRPKAQLNKQGTSTSMNYPVSLSMSESSRVPKFSITSFSDPNSVTLPGSSCPRKTSASSSHLSPTNLQIATLPSLSSEKMCIDQQVLREIMND